MAKFASKWTDYQVKLRSGSKYIENGLVMKREPVFAQFKGGIFNTNSEQVTSMPLTEKQVIDTLRSHKRYTKDFYEINRNPQTADDLLNLGIRDLREVINEIDQASVIKEAMEKDDRESAIPIYEKRLAKI